MQITGAIFDLDGTLVDSMWMWRRSFGDVLEDLHINMTPDFFKRVEAISLYDGCVACIEEFNLPLSAEELYEKFLVYVQTVYSHNIESIVGAADFLRELFDAGIPLAIASSTPSRAIHVALEAQGMEKFFKAVVCTEDVGGVDKAKPDVYLEALRRLGTDKAHTWVFEDAEFGVHTAQTEGFPVVALFNGKDGRDLEYMKAHSDLLAHDYRELSLARIYDYERVANQPHLGVSSAQKAFSVLVVDGSPTPSSAALVSELAACSDYVVAADRGAYICKEAGVVPDIACGDFDSAGEDILSWIHAQKVCTISYPQDKYETDLSLSLNAACHEATRQALPLSLTLTCASGGRLDHELGVVGLLARLSTIAWRVRIVEDTFEARILSADTYAVWRLSEKDQGRTLSVLPLQEETVITETGMQWDLASRTLPLLSDEGISNVVQTDAAQIQSEKGKALVVLLAKES